MKESKSDQPMFFSGKWIGESLKEVSVDFIETEKAELMSRWFHGEPGTDLYAWLDNRQNVIKQQLSFVGQVVEWNCLDGLKTGVVIESDLGVSTPNTQKPEDSKRAVSETVQFDQAPQSTAIKLALEILSNLQVDEKLKNQLMGNFQDPQHLQTMSPQDFMRRFGQSLRGKKSEDSHPWESFVSWLSQLFRKSA
ncbi:MAG: hypothetical protein IT289_00730 [Oligoflexia bacterium]|nr:hypothetical protein [Oligoflexia bacterium]